MNGAVACVLIMCAFLAVVAHHQVQKPQQRLYDWTREGDFEDGRERHCEQDA